MASIETRFSEQWGQLFGEIVAVDAYDVRIRWDRSVPGTRNAHVSDAMRGVNPAGLLYTRGEYDKGVREGRFVVSCEAKN